MANFQRFNAVLSPIIKNKEFSNTFYFEIDYDEKDVDTKKLNGGKKKKQIF